MANQVKFPNSLAIKRLLSCLTFPPCTHLAGSSSPSIFVQPIKRLDSSEACTFFLQLHHLHILKVFHGLTTGRNKKICRLFVLAMMQVYYKLGVGIMQET